MNKISPYLILSCIALLIFYGCNNRSGKPKILVFTKTAGFQHESIPAGVAAIQKLGAENGFEVDTTSDATMFSDSTLPQYSAVVFLNTTGPLLNTPERIALERYIQAGGGYVGIHAAADAEYDWGWYNRLAGARFESHPKIQEARLDIKDSKHPATEHLPAVWTRKDEWYNFKNLNPNVHVLITIDENSYEGGKNGENHPMAWYHEYDGGRAFYTGLGHTPESYSDPLYLGHLLGGIQYAIGKNKKLNYKKATSQYPPDEDRFTKTMLVQGEFFEPTEMTILPNLDVLVAQRRGEIMLYKNATGKVKQAGFIEAYFKTKFAKANTEEGVLGISKDPNFDKNKWVYIYYALPDTSLNRLSRFKFENDTLDNKTEQVILEFYEQREICCHTGGSIAFGPDGLLYLSTGDNSTPFDEPGQPFVNHGFGPMDDRPGHEQYDARRSSSNTNDLRGKILRLKIHEDGSYEIPEGNLFPRGTEKTRPEIYVMGLRNPYRISVDQKNSFLYWGDVGPDAFNDSFGIRGPRGYDELNQARKAGYFGWPLFVGNNYPYNRYNYATGESGPEFDPKRPVNDSRNNTGLSDLPPVSPAFIWYPYAASADFPQVGSGGRTAMAGPVYYTDMWPSESRLPDYYHGKLFIYEWIRGWVKVVTMLENGDFDRMEPFMESTKWNNAIDMELGPDGKIYVLEYGSGWFAKNEDAGLVRIDYNSGNRPPKLHSLTVDKTSGGIPLRIKATATAKDPENDPLTYYWTTSDGQKKQTSTADVDFTFNAPGDYSIIVEVKDKKGATSKKETAVVYAGNTAPEVAVRTKGNQFFYFAGKPVVYEVLISDKEDGNKVATENLLVQADFIQEGDMASVPKGHQEAGGDLQGKSLMLSLDCSSCHKIAEKSVGPSYTEVAKRYHGREDARPYLVDKIISGGSGVWGEVAMAAHPDIPESDVKQIVQWILSLHVPEQKTPSLPQKGEIPVKEIKGNQSLYISAAYTDRGGPGIRPLSGSAVQLLNSPRLLPRKATRMDGYSMRSVYGKDFLVVPSGNSAWFSIDSVGLEEVSGMTLAFSWASEQTAPKGEFIFELRLGSPDGRQVAAGTLDQSAFRSKTRTAVLHLNFPAITNKEKQNLYFISIPKDNQQTDRLELEYVELESK